MITATSNQQNTLNNVSSIVSKVNVDDPQIKKLMEERNRQKSERRQSISESREKSIKKESSNIIQDRRTKVIGEIEFLEDKIAKTIEYIETELEKGRQHVKDANQRYENGVFKLLMNENTRTAKEAQIEYHKSIIESLENDINNNNFDEVESEYYKTRLADLLLQKTKRIDKLNIIYFQWAENKYKADLDGEVVPGKAQSFGLRKKLNDYKEELKRLDVALENAKKNENIDIDAKYNAVKDHVDEILTAPKNSKSKKAKKVEVTTLNDEELEDELTKMISK
jgi:hypothetical protein